MSDEYVKRKKSAQSNIDRIFVARRHPVSNDLRNYFMNKYPELIWTKKSPLLKLFVYIHLSNMAFVDMETNKVVIFQELLSVMEQKQNKCVSGHYVAEDLLIKYKEVFPDFEYSGWNFYEGKSRIVLNTGLDDQDMEMINSEKLKSIINPVNIYNGKPCKLQSVRTEIKEFYSDLVDKLRTQNKLNTDQDKSITYLSGLHSTLFDKVIKQIPEAKIYIDNSGWSKDKKEIAIRNLDSILLDPKPRYLPTEKNNSPRIFTEGLTLATINKQVKSILLKSTYELDLQSSQFAILAEHLKAEKCLNFIKLSNNPDAKFEEKTIWNSFQVYLSKNNIEFDLAEDKHKWKTALYSICFGMNKFGVKKELGKFEILLNHPLMKELIEKRDVELENIKNVGYLEDCYGKKHIVSANRNEKSVLAGYIQAIEFKIISTVFEHANKEIDVGGKNRYRIVLFQHDGFSIYPIINDKTTNEEHMINEVYQELNCMVRSVALDCGVVTKLTMEKL